MRTFDRRTRRALILLIAATAALAIHARPAHAAAASATAAPPTAAPSARTSVASPMCPGCGQLLERFIARVPPRAAQTVRTSVYRAARRYVTKAVLIGLACQAMYRYFDRDIARWEDAAAYYPGVGRALQVCVNRLP